MTLLNGMIIRIDGRPRLIHLKNRKENKILRKINWIYYPGVTLTIPSTEDDVVLVDDFIIMFPMEAAIDPYMLPPQFQLVCGWQ